MLRLPVADGMYWSTAAMLIDALIESDILPVSSLRSRWLRELSLSALSACSSIAARKRGAMVDMFPLHSRPALLITQSVCYKSETLASSLFVPDTHTPRT